MWKSTDASVEAGQDVVWTAQRGDGRYAILGKIVDLANVYNAGRLIKIEKAKGGQVELRISEEDKDYLFEELEELESRGAHVTVQLDGPVSASRLTLQTGEVVPSAVFPSEILDVTVATSTLQSDHFETDEDHDKFWEENAQRANQSLSAYRAGLQAAQAAQEEISEEEEAPTLS